MKKSVWCLCFLFFGLVSAQSATTLASYVGTSAPSMQGWGVTQPSGSTILTSQVVEDGRNAWRVEDPGVTTSARHLYYSKTVTVGQTDLMFSQGWEMSVTLKIPETAGLGDWARDRGITIGFTHSIPGDRRFYSLIFGRDAAGSTSVSIYGSAAAAKFLSPGFHKYTVRYLPGDTAASVYIDGAYWETMQGGLLGSVGTSTILWGDNYSGNTPQRIAFYESVALAIIPEPSKALLGVFGVMGLIMRRKRA